MHDINALKKCLAYRCVSHNIWIEIFLIKRPSGFNGSHKSSEKEVQYLILKFLYVIKRARKNLLSFTQQSETIALSLSQDIIKFSFESMKILSIKLRLNLSFE